MRIFNFRALVSIFSVLAATCVACGAQLPPLDDGRVYATNGSGVYGYKNTPKLPWCGYLVHDPDRPAPRMVDAGRAPAPAPVPADAIVLFGGKDLSEWGESKWKVENGEIVAAAGSLTSKQQFGDMQLHIEWMMPANWEGPWYNRGNNGVVLMGQYEIQIYDSYDEKWCPDGQCGAVYGQTPPLVNPIRKPGEWQTYDIVFTAAKFQDGKQIASPRITMFFNGVLVHQNQEIYGGTGHAVLPRANRNIAEGPIVLAGHDCPVRFRNIWVRKL